MEEEESKNDGSATPSKKKKSTSDLSEIISSKEKERRRIKNGGKNKRPLGMLFLCRISASEKYPKRPDLFLRKWQQSFVSKGIIFFNEIFRFFDLILCRLHFQRLVTIYLIV